MKAFCLLLSVFSFVYQLQAAVNEDLIVHNRILAKVNGKSISVVDVMKKMEVFLSQAHSEKDASSLSHYQFYLQNWKDTLNQMIDNELIIADAEKLEMKITDAEIREKIHERFGPNIMKNLDQLGISHDEAWNMIYAEIAVQRMSWYRVHSKALGRVGPQDIKNEYEIYLSNTQPQEEWKYQVLSVRAASESIGNVFAKKAQNLLRSDSLPFETLAKLFQNEMKDADLNVTVSNEYQVSGEEISSEHKAVLCSLEPGKYSDLITQVSRREKTKIHRVFFLKEHKITPQKSFEKMVDSLHNQLVMDEVHKEFPVYLKKLRKQFNYEENEINAIPDDFVPFEIKAR